MIIFFNDKLYMLVTLPSFTHSVTLARGSTSISENKGEETHTWKATWSLSAYITIEAMINVVSHVKVSMTQKTIFHLLNKKSSCC
jgi:hypothetical protein